MNQTERAVLGVRIGDVELRTTKASTCLDGSSLIQVVVHEEDIDPLWADIRLTDLKYLIGAMTRIDEHLSQELKDSQLPSCEFDQA